MKNIEVLEYGRLDKETMEMITGGDKPGSDCIIAGCTMVSGSNYYFGECAWYTQCGSNYMSCISKEDYSYCAGGIQSDSWFRKSQSDKPTSGYTFVVA